MNKIQVVNAPARARTVPYRVVQWATGNIGSRSLRTVIEHPNLSLVGLYVHSEAKAGRDAGELCGLPEVGVSATRDIDEVVALRADCVLYMQQGANIDDICKLLRSGTNIVTTRTEFHNPARMEPAVRERIEDACSRGRTSLHSTGSSPGFITEALPIVLTSLQRRLDCIRINEYANVSSRESPGLLFDIMGFNQAPEKASSEGRTQYLRASFGPSLEVVANALGLSFDSIEAFGEVACAQRDTKIAAGVIGAGKVAAQRTTVTGIRNGKPLVSFTANWYCTDDIDADWKLRPNGWNIAVEGDTPLDVDIRFPVPLEHWAATSPGLTAHRAVNAVPYVCEAAPGIRTSVELPQIMADLSEPQGRFESRY
jgi:4-hydroxy-tetrahydrodipicolinate reductase